MLNIRVSKAKLLQAQGITIKPRAAKGSDQGVGLQSKKDITQNRYQKAI